MDFKNSDIANGLDVTSLIGADASASLEGAALLKMALQSGNIMPLTADGQLVLPAGVGLDDIKVVGRDLIIQMPDGTQMIVPDGAIIVPQIVVDGVAIPALNFAALLAGQEPQPAAGLPQSSGGNFADNVGDIGDPFALGDLLPPTQLAFPQPEEREVVPGLVDRDPDVIIQDGGPAGRDVVDNVNETGLPGTRANGNVESPGSAAGNGSDSTTGTIFVTSPDGIASITINGVVVTGAAGQQITTPLGVLTLSALNGDQIGYTYRLLDNTSGDTTTDAFLVSLTDPDGDVATARLTIDIADDVPTARNDIDSLAGGTFGPELGNVLTGAGTISGLAGADTLGADGAAISGFRAGASSSFAAVGSNIAGQYGTLTLGANGSYSYVRNVNTPGGVTDVFTYQLTDTDGDASTATLTINIGDAPNRITFIPDIGDGTIVREPHLPARDSEPSGSQFDGNAEATSGTITFNSPDGVGNVTVAGAVLTPGALPQLVSSNATGSLVVTAYAYNPVTGIGSITYVYTLNDNTLNTNGESLSFPVVVTDLDGDVASDSLIIKIVDDAPLAANDSGTQQSENAPVSINVFVNDTPGADGINLATGVSVVAGSLTGAGALAYSNNGIFTYTPAPGEEGVVTFQYVITDGDGDTSTATVTISLLEDSFPSVEVRGENVVSEAGLPSGSDATSNSETTGGTIAIATGGDSLASLVINNVDVTAGGTVTGASGTLTVSVSQGVYSYSYTLTDNTSGDATTDSFNVIVTDSDGDSATDTLVIAIQDDVPSAVDDADAIAAGTYGPVTGNVITDAEGDGGADTPGADGATVTTVMGSTAGAVGGTTAGTYGVLVLNADGSYIYTRNAGTEGGVSDVFTYTLIDGDGDIAIATLTISIADSPTTLDLPTAGEAGTLVDEAGLANGSDADSTNETTSGSIAFTAPDGPATVTLDGQAVTSVGQIFAGSFGILTVTSIANGAIGYSYTLTTNTAGDTTFDDFAVVVTDQDGDATAGTLVIDIIDDMPTARADIDSVTEDGPTVADGNVITGANVADVNSTDGVADTQGADGVSLTAFSFGANAGVVGSALAGTYGALTMNANGSYSYALNNANAAVQGLDGDDSLTEVFTYIITDGDGDTATTTLTVTINGSDDPITIDGLSVSGPDLIVDEDDLSDGSSPNAPALTQNGTFTVNGVDGIASIKIGGVETFVGQTVTNAYGTFTITSLSAPANGNATAITVGYRYVLTDNTAHANANGENFITEIFSVAVTDTDGSTDTDQVEVRIIDDVPTAVNDADIIASGSNLPAVGNVITDAELDGGKDTAGADTVTVTAITGAAAGTVGGSTAGTYGVLTLNADGSYSYLRNDGTPGNVQDVFSYTITDGDGDTSTATLTITIQDDSPFVGPNAVVLLDDDALAGGNPGGTGDDSDAANVAGTLSGSGGDGALTFAYQLTGAPTGFNYVAGPSGSVLVQQGGTTVLTVTLNSATGAYTVTQNAPIAHAAGGDENNAPFTLSYTVTDVDGDAANGTLVVNVDDDTPVVTANGAVPTLTVDETVLGDDASASFAGIFTTNYEIGRAHV
jgi:VCBS repeat-containing protein